MTERHGTAAQRDMRGLYGLRIAGLESAADTLNPVPNDWLHLSVERETGPSSHPAYFVGEDFLEYTTFDQTGQRATVRLTRDPLAARFTSEGGFTDAAIVHPDLSLLAAVANRWSRRDAFHAGAFLHDGSAWAVMGAREAGKSSLLGHLAGAGVPVLSDDLVVVDENGDALAGPRCVDLREDAADRLGLGTDIGLVGARRRWRMRLPAIPAAVPFRGWIVPSWGDRIEIVRVPAARRLPMLIDNRYLAQTPVRPDRLLALAALPVLEFRRPRRWETTKEATDSLLDQLPV